jgi:succinate dehydrogenase / fumarate reductase iron-sulfur subunit
VSSYEARFRVWRGDADGGGLRDFTVEVNDGEVVLDIVHRIQATQAPDLAVRWNCKAAKCGSCSAEIDGRPRLMCKTRVDEFGGRPITVRPMHTFPHVKDLVTDVRWNYEKNKEIPPFAPSPSDASPWTIHQRDVDRVQEFRKCIECFLCQDVCHVLRNHERKDAFYGPRFMIRIASLEMHPKDTGDRVPLLAGDAGVQMCNITKCCTEVCPEHIHITDNGIIPMKERMADQRWDPVRWVFRKVRAPAGKELVDPNGLPVERA